MFFFMIFMEEDVFLIIFLVIFGFIDVVLLFVMLKEEFDECYNKKWIKSDYVEFGWYCFYGNVLVLFVFVVKIVEKEWYFKKKGV